MIKFLLFALAIIFFRNANSQSGHTFPFLLSNPNCTGCFDFSKMDLKDPDPDKRLHRIEEINRSTQALVLRSEKTIKLDSIIELQPPVRNTMKFQYTPADKSASTDYFNLALSGDTIYGYREVYGYDQFNQVIQLSLFFWSSALHDWIYLVRREFEYNTDHYLISTTDYGWDGIELKPESKNIITYNTSHLVITEVNNIWDASLSVWAENTKYDYTYTPFKQLKSAIFSVMTETAAWEFASKTEYAYGQGLLLNKIISYWKNGSFWENNTRSEYTYDGQKNLVSQIDKIWRTDISFWYNLHLFQYFYDANDREVSSSKRHWIEGGFEWFEDDSLTISYNSIGDTNIIIRLTWSNSQPGFVPEEMIEYSYDEGIDFSDILWPEPYIKTIGNDFQKKVIGKTIFEYFTNVQLWGPVDSIKYYYSLTTGTTDISFETISVVPNPASNEIRINLPGLTSDAQLYIYDMEGKSVLSIPFRSDQQISIQQLYPGTYGLIIVKEDKIYTGKLIVQR